MGATLPTSSRTPSRGVAAGPGHRRQWGGEARPPRRPRRRATRANRWSSCGRPSTRCGSSASCGWRSCRPSVTSASTSPPRPSTTTGRSSTRSTSASIDARERVTRHDVKARIEEFSALAGHEHAHKGMTSRDLTENVEQLQVRRSLELVRDRMVDRAGPAGRAGGRARHAGDGRPQPQRRRPGHHARQAVRQRRRGAAAGLPPRRGPARPLPAAGHQGPGRHPAGPARPARRRRRQASTGSRQAVARPPRVRRRPHQRRARSIPARSTSTSWPPSSRPTAGPSSLATTIRLMAGHELVTEGFAPGQVGSSAMPHKMNTRSCRADQRPGRGRARLPVDGVRAGRRPVERGRRVAARSCAGWRCPAPSSPPTACSRRSCRCSTGSAPTPR